MEFKNIHSYELLITAHYGHDTVYLKYHVSTQDTNEKYNTQCYTMITKFITP